MKSLGPPARCPSLPFLFGWEGSPSKIDYRKNGTLILSSLPEDLVVDLETCQDKRDPPKHVILLFVFGLPKQSQAEKGTLMEAQTIIVREG